MKKFSIILFVFLMCLTLSVPAFAAGAPRLYDGADLLTESEEATLLARLDKISEAHQVEVIIATVSELDGLSPDGYVEYYYDSGDYGYGDNRDGVLLLISMEDRDWRILSNGFGATAITTDEIDAIGEDIVSYLGDEDYVAAFNAFADECEYQINGERNGFPFNYGKNLLIALIIGLVVAFIATGVMKGKLKSVHRKVEADSYVKGGSMQVSLSNDIFLYRTVNRVKKESSSSSSSSGGSSRNVGGGKF